VDRHRFEIRSGWDGAALRDDEWAWIEIAIGDALEVTLEASFHSDPAPAVPPGRCFGLWDHEVVELFLLGEADRYLELEFGPHGHWLALQLAGRRQIVDRDVALEFEAQRSGARWRGRARVPRAQLPPGLFAANAYAIHGTGAGRRHLAWQPVPGPQPDFHRLECFAPLARALQSSSASVLPETDTKGTP
jgi:hypothetical protein